MSVAATALRRFDGLGLLAFAVTVATGLLVGSLVAGSTSLAVVAIGGIGLILVWLVRPLLLVDIAIFLSVATLPPNLAVAKVVGPVAIFPYEILILLAMVVLARIAILTFNEVAPGVVFLLGVTTAAVAGVLGGSDPVYIAREAQYLVEMVAGFYFALLIVRAGYAARAIQTLGVMLWFSMGMIVLASVGVVTVDGRTESLTEETGTVGAVRLITATSEISMVVVCAVVLGVILRRARKRHLLGLGLPALVIQLLSFTRSLLIVLAVASFFVLVTVHKRALWIGAAKLFGGLLAGLLVGLPSLALILSGTAAGTWLSGQIQAYIVRVFDGISGQALARDKSALYRWRENDHLYVAFGDSPTTGHGLGYAYQLPAGRFPDFSATDLGTTYSHNFYLWILVKAGVIGLIAFLVFLLPPLVAAVRSRSVTAKAAASLTIALAAVCWVSPMPLQAPSSLVFGATIGVTMGLARYPNQIRLRGNLSPDGRTAVAADVNDRIPEFTAKRASGGGAPSPA